MSWGVYWPEELVEGKPYDTQKVEGGWQVWHVKGNRPTDDERIYASRQNAYARKDQLNETRHGACFEISLRLHRKHCQSAIELLEQAFGDKGIDFCVIDDLDEDEIRKDLRNIVFKYRCLAEQEGSRMVVHRFSRRHPLLSPEELKAKLESISKMLSLVQNIFVKQI